MPLALPGGLIPGPVPFNPVEVLTGNRVTDFLVERLDRDENLIGTLDGVLSQGSYVEWKANTAVKGGGALAVEDQHDEVDWLNERIRVSVLLSSLTDQVTPEVIPLSGQSAQPIPLGVFLPAAPTESWDDTGRAWTIELTDKLAILDSDIPTDAAGNPKTMTFVAGTNVIDAVVALITSTGEYAPAIQPSTKTLRNAMTWDMGTTLLSIINDLLNAAGFFSLWCDGSGQYQVTPYLTPNERTPVYSAIAPFAPGGVMSPEWTRDRNIYSIPNRYVAVGQGDETTAALVSVVTNVDPRSPFSYPSRGRWITQVVTGVEATSQAALDARAWMGLSQASSVMSSFQIKHAYLPDLLINCAVMFTNPDAGLDLLCYVQDVSIPLDPTELCTSTLREAAI